MYLYIYRVKAPDVDYDLAAGKVIISPNPVIAHAKYSHEYSIQNKGPSTIPSETFEVEFYIDGHLANFDRRTSEMRPGQVIFYYGKSDAKFSAGAHSYRLVDPDHRLKETNEGNNILEGSFLVVSQK